MIRKAVSHFITLVAFMSAAATPASSQGTGDLEGLKHRVERLEALVSQLQQYTTPVEISVDCNAGQTVGAALAQADGKLGPVRITVKGVCRESVTISRDDVTLQGLSTADGLWPIQGSVALWILRARHVSLSKLSVTGGVEASNGASFVADGLLIQNSATFPVAVQDGATGLLVNSTVQGGLGWGLAALPGGYLRVVNCQVRKNVNGVFVPGGTVTLEGSTVEENDHSAAQVMTGGTLHVLGGSIRYNSRHAILLMGNASAYIAGALISNNALYGVHATGGSTVTLTDATINDNSGPGVRAANASHVWLNTNVVISGNGEDGIQLRDISRGSGGSNITVTNNTGYGIKCDGPIVSLQSGFPLPTFNLSGNTAGPHNCGGN